MSLHLDIKKTALVVIDLEHGIISIPGLAPYTAAQVVERTRTLADAFRAKGGTVVWTHVLLHETTQLPADKPMQSGAEPPPPSASEIVPEAGVQPQDPIIAKRQWGAFYGTNLEQTLDRHGIETILLAGIATNLGVESTARAAFDAGYALLFAEDAMTSISADGHTFSTTNLFPMMGKVRTTKEILAAM